MNYSARERFAQLMQSQGQAMAAPVQGTRSSQMMSAVRMANGGAVNALPTLQEMADPNYQFQGVQLGASAPFTQMNPIVPMFNLESPAFGGMEQSTYDFTAPVVQGGSMYQPQRQAPAITQSTSAYSPVDATTVMDSSGNIPNVPSDPYAQPNPYTFVDPNTPAPYVPPVAQTQPVAQPAPVITQPAPVAQPGVATTGTAIPSVITAEERERRAAAAQAERDRIAQEEAQAREQAGIQAELERRRAAQQAEAEAAAAEEAQRLQQQEQARIIAAQAERDRIAQAQAQEQAAAAAGAEAERRQKAQAASDAAEQAERARQAEAIKRNKNNELMNLLSGGIRDVIGGEGLPIYDPNQLVSVTRLVDGGRGGQIVERIPQSQYDIEQARARAYQEAFGA